MDIEGWELLKKITPEERAILEGAKAVQQNLYTDQMQFVIEHEKLIEDGRLIAVRKHTRFAHFPLHTHNYVEIFYVVSGSITHIIQGAGITIRAGELLFMNQHVQHEILECGEDDLAVNFIVMPEFFGKVMQMVGEGNILADFMVNILQQKGGMAQYLYFPVAYDRCIQSLMGNIIFSITHKQHNTEHIHQTAMGLLFLYLLNQAEKVRLPSNNEAANMLMMAVRQYIREEYRTGTLHELAGRIGYSQSALSRLIKKYTGMNFKEIQARQRMERAYALLCQTSRPVSEIAAEVGYENQNFFYKRFHLQYDMTPKEARRQSRQIEG